MSNKIKDYEIKDGKIIRFVPVTPKEALQALADNNGEPVEGFAFRIPFGRWNPDTMTGYASGLFESTNGTFEGCARIETIDPRAVPEGVAELPEPWLAFIGVVKWGSLGANKQGNVCIYDDEDGWHKNWSIPLNNIEYPVAIDVRTEFARKHFPEYVEAVGYVEDRYGYLTNGEPVPAPPEGWEIAEENEELPFPVLVLSERTRSWYQISGSNQESRIKAAIGDGSIRAYARRVSRIAKGHNPDKLTEDQVGVADGWRLLSVEEINPSRAVSCKMELWDKRLNTWARGPIAGAGIVNTYRTREPEGAFLPKPEAKPDPLIAAMNKMDPEKSCMDNMRILWDAAIASTKNDSELLEFILDLINDWGTNGLKEKLSWSPARLDRERIRAAMKGGAK